MKLIVLALILLLIVPQSEAQVYKCQEGGRTVITDRPCHAGATPIEIKPAAGDYDSRADMRATEQLARDKKMTKELRRTREADEAERAAARTAAEAEPDACDLLHEDYAEAKRLAARYTHPLNIYDANLKAERASDEMFFKCPPHRRVSALR